MANPTIVDTDILIDVGRGVPDAIAFLTTLQATTSLAISAISEMELLVGCRDKAEMNSVEVFLQGFQIVKVNEAISDKAVELVKNYRLSHGLLIADAIIAATALTTNYPFITKNQKHFRFVAGLNLLAYP